MLKQWLDTMVSFHSKLLNAFARKSLKILYISFNHFVHKPMLSICQRKQVCSSRCWSSVTAMHQVALIGSTKLFTTCLKSIMVIKNTLVDKES